MDQQPAHNIPHLPREVRARIHSWNHAMRRQRLNDLPAWNARRLTDIQNANAHIAAVNADIQRTQNALQIEMDSLPDYIGDYPEAIAEHNERKRRLEDDLQRQRHMRALLEAQRDALQHAIFNPTYRHPLDIDPEFHPN